MASPNSPCNNGGNDGTEHSSVGEESVIPVQSLKGMSLGGLNGDMRHSSNTGDAQTRLSPPDKATRGQPKPRLSWGQVTEIPTGVSSSETNSCEVEQGGLPVGGASSSGNPWQVRSTQNPSKPLVRRPTPMVIRVPKSVLGNDVAKMSSFEENEEEDDEDNGDHHQPVSSNELQDMDTMIVEDIEVEENMQGPSLSAPQDLPAKPVVDEHVMPNQRDLNAVSPAVFVQTEFGKQMSLDEVENDEGADDDNNQEDEEGECQEENQFLSPSNSISFGKADPPTTNTHAQTVPHQPRKFVRRDTPQALDIPERVKSLAATSMAGEILEEEEEEQEEEDKADNTNAAHNKSEHSQKATIVLDQTCVQKSEVQKSSEPFDSNGSYGSYSSNVDNGSTGERDSNQNSAFPTSTHDFNVVNCKNNNQEAPSIDTTNGARTTTESRDGLVPKSDYHSQFRERDKQSRFKKSMSAEKKDGGSSPSSVRRKVSPHHTKILTRQPTPVQIDVPKHLLSESFKSTAPPAFLEEEEEN